MQNFQIILQLFLSIIKYNYKTTQNRNLRLYFSSSERLYKIFYLERKKCFQKKVFDSLLDLDLKNVLLYYVVRIKNDRSISIN
jgi:hypothetical protein